MSENIRIPIASGMFYPREEEVLKNNIRELLNEAKIKTGKRSPKGFSVISPHAGYYYSGKGMAFSFKALKNFNTYIILGTNHINSTTSLCSQDFLTPLGVVKTDKKILRRLKKRFPIKNEFHAVEHSIEVQLPFLQMTKPNAKIVAIQTSVFTENQIETLSKIKNVGFIISSDFTHYGQNYHYYGNPPFAKNVKKNIYSLDKKAINKIINADIDGFKNFLMETNATICGSKAILLFLKSSLRAYKKIKGELLNYYTSGDINNEWKNCVGYASIVFKKI